MQSNDKLLFPHVSAWAFILWVWGQIVFDVVINETLTYELLGNTHVLALRSFVLSHLK